MIETLETRGTAEARRHGRLAKYHRAGLMRFRGAGIEWRCIRSPKTLNLQLILVSGIHQDHLLEEWNGR